MKIHLVLGLLAIIFFILGAAQYWVGRKATISVCCLLLLAAVFHFCDGFYVLRKIPFARWNEYSFLRVLPGIIASLHFLFSVFLRWSEMKLWDTQTVGKIVNAVHAVSWVVAVSVIIADGKEAFIAALLLLLSGAISFVLLGLIKKHITDNPRFME